MTTKDKARETERHKLEISPQEEWYRQAIERFGQSLVYEFENLPLELQEKTARIEMMRHFWEVEELEQLLELWVEGLDEVEVDEARGFLEAAGVAIPGAFNTKPLTAITHTNPLFHKVPIHKVIDQMVMSDFSTTGAMERIIVGRTKGRKPVITNTTLTMAWESDSVSVPERFTLEDRAVHDAVCTLLDGGNGAVTAKMVANQMRGAPLGKYVGAKTEAKVTQSLRKCQMMLMAIDFRAEAKFKRLTEIPEATLKRYILPLDEIEVTNRSGVKQRAYRLIETPPLYEYAKITRQIISIPQEVHQRPRAVKMSDAAVVIEQYLYRRIEIMRRNQNKKQSNRILTKTLFDACQLRGDRVQHKRWRDTVEGLLDSMQDAGAIGDYRIIKGPKSSTEAYEILLDERDET